MKKLKKLLIVSLLFCVFSCNNEDEVTLLNDEQTLFLGFISITEHDENHVSFEIHSKSVDKLIEEDGSSFEHNGVEYVFQVDRSNELINGRSLISINGITITPLFSTSANFGDIVLSTFVSEYNGGNFNSNGSYTCAGGCQLVEHRSDIDFGSPSSNHRASSGLNGNHGNTLHGHVSAGIWNSPGYYTYSLLENNAQKFNCDSRIRSTVSWDGSTQDVAWYSLNLRCDD